MICETAPLISNRAIAPNVHELVVKTSAKVVKAGRFYMLKKINGAVLLARPISVCDFVNGNVVFLVQCIGKGTAELCEMRAGDTLNITGPLGNGFPVDEALGNIALVGGGIGIAPMLLTAKELKAKGRLADCYLGYRSTPFYTEAFEDNVKQLFISTDDGSAGFCGNVGQMLKPEKYDAVFCCGPLRMMQAVTQLCQKTATPVYISMENKMACGVGGCLVCTCAIKNKGNLRTCMEGPVFRGEDVDFES